MAINANHFEDAEKILNSIPIDTAISRHRELANYIDEIGDGSGFREVADMLEELKWYREQDLLQRKDVINPIRYCHGDNIALCRSRKCSECYQEEIMKIPKAEPTQENEVVMKPIDGDCETCDYFDTDYCGNYCGYRKAEERLLDGVANGDCETCKHYSTEVCGECFKSMGDSRYEPYIPKENE